MDITQEMLRTFLEDVRAARIATDKALEEAQAEVARLEAAREEVARLEREQHHYAIEEAGYRLTMNRLFPGADIDVPDDSSVSEVGLAISDDAIEVDDLTRMTRAAAVERAVQVLSSRNGAASPAEIEEFMSGGGRSDTRDQIGAALAYLNKRRTVERASRARWRMFAGTGIDEAPA